MKLRVRNVEGRKLLADNDVQRTKEEIRRIWILNIEKKRLNWSPLSFQRQSHTHTIDWYIKWVSSIILIVGMVLTANNLFPWNVLVQCLGIAGWLIVSVMWNDRALIIVNAVGVAILLNGFVGYLLEV